MNKPVWCNLFIMTILQLQQFSTPRMKISRQIKIDDLLTLTEAAVVLIRVATEVVAEEDKVDMVGALLLAHYFRRRTMDGMKYSTPSMVCLLTSDPKIMMSRSFFHPPMYVRIALKAGLINRSTGPTQL